MAVLALGFAGQAIGTSIGGSLLGVSATAIGGFIGSQIGGLIDNMLFASGQRIEGPRLDDLRVTASTYGRPIPIGWGPENRMAGNMIWSTGLIETKKTQRSGGKGGPSVSQTEYTYRVSLAIALVARPRPIRRIRKIWANGELIFDAGASTSMVFSKGDGTHDVFETLRVYPGDFEQTPDPTIESYLGVGETPAYRGTAYAVLADLQLADFGNRIPNLEFLLECDERITVAGVCREICAAAGLDPNEVSTSALTDELRGYVVAAENTCHQALQPLALVYDFDTAEVWGGLRLQRRALGAAGTIELDDLAGHEFDNQRPEAIRWTRDAETELPFEATITFHDPDRDFQPNSQSARRSSGTAQSSLASEVAVVMDADKGREVADRMLWEAWTGRGHASTNLTDKWLALEPGRGYVIDTPVGRERVRASRKIRGANGVIEVELRRDRIDVYRSNAQGARATIPPNTVQLAGDTELVLIDSPIFSDLDNDAGFYWLTAGEGPGWRGADVIRSSDGGATYGELGPSGASAVLGRVQGGTGSGPTALFDLVTELVVDLDRADEELVSVSMLELLNGANACWIGPDNGRDGEVLQFLNADALGAGLYRLTGLLRGRLGTEHAMDQPGGRRFVLLEGFAINRSDFGASDWNRERLYKAVSLLQAETDVDPQAFSNSGEGKRPLSPVHIRGERDGSDDLLLTWKRRSRLRQPGLGNGPLAIGEQALRFEVDILSGSTVLRTINASEEAALYTAAEQTADGLTPGNPVSVRVYQISDARGRGRPGAATV